MKRLLGILLLTAALGGASGANANHEQGFYNDGGFSIHFGQSRQTGRYRAQTYGAHDYDNHYHHGSRHHAGHEFGYSDEPGWSAGRYGYSEHRSVFPWFDNHAQGSQGYSWAEDQYAAQRHAKKKVQKQRKIKGKRKQKQRKAKRRKAKKRNR